MSAFHPIIVSPVTGELVPFGTRHRILEEHFLEAEIIPDWLATSGTYLWQQPQQVGGFARITTAATAGASAEIKTKRLFGLQHTRGMALTVDGYRASDNGIGNLGIALVNDARTAGVTFQHRDGQPTAEFVLHNGATSTTVPVPYQLNGGTGRPSSIRSLTLLYSRMEKFAAILAGDTVAAIVNTDGLVADSHVMPRVFLSARAAAAQWLQIETIRYEQWA